MNHTHHFETKRRPKIPFRFSGGYVHTFFRVALATSFLPTLQQHLKSQRNI
jgi:hypothetical protein